MGTSIDYGTVPHETIYNRITGGPGSIDMVDASRGWQSVAAKLQELQGRVDQAVRGIGAAQQGAAADAATHATIALTPWVGDGVTAANQLAARISEQAASFAHTRDNMPEPLTVPEVSFSQDPGTWMGNHAVEWLPGIQTDHERALVAAQQTEQRARELMSAYQGTSNDNLTVHQQFAPAPTVVAEVGEAGAGLGGALGGGSAHLGPAHLGSAHPAAVHPAAHAGSIAGGQGVSAPAATVSQLAPGTHQAPAAVSPQVAGGYPRMVDQPGAAADSARPAGTAPFGPSPILAGPGAAGGDRLRGGSRFSGGGGLGGGGGVSGASGFGPRPSTSASAGDLRPTGGGAGYGNPMHGSAESAGAGRSARGGAGWAGAPLGGATGGSGRDGNTEHQRPSYLIEQDTNTIVGDLPRVAPAVIGDDG